MKHSPCSTIKPYSLYTHHPSTLLIKTLRSVPSKYIIHHPNRRMIDLCFKDDTDINADAADDAGETIYSSISDAPAGILKSYTNESFLPQSLQCLSQPAVSGSFEFLTEETLPRVFRPVGKPLLIFNLSTLQKTQIY